MNEKIIRIATRSSKLAIAQAHIIGRMLCATLKDHQYQLITKTTQGDIKLDTPLFNIGGKGLFVKEVEQALLENEADIAVHSLKDMPIEQPDPLPIKAITKREFPLDVWLSQYQWGKLPNGAVIGTSSPRRHCQIQALCPTAIIKPIRGNVQTRINKWEEGEFDAIILAEAGLKRLALDIPYTVLQTQEMLPAAGQGALAIQCRPNFQQTNAVVEALDHRLTHMCTKIERHLIAQLGAACQSPLAVFAEQQEDCFRLRAHIGSPCGQKHASVDLSNKGAQNIVETAFNELLAQNAKELLNQIWPTTT